MAEKQIPNYYAIIPAEIRYDNKLTANAKLLYGEITALSSKTGECWASDNYFAELYGVTKDCIQKWMKQLVDGNYITREVIYKENSKEIEKRIIKIYSAHNKNLLCSTINIYRENNINNNNINNNNISGVKEIVEYLNSRINSKYKYSSDSTKRHIEARLNEGFTVEDCKHVIDVKYADWYGTDYEKYLRPETLFGSKFQNYLNQKLTPQQSVICKRHNPEDSSGVIF